MLGIVGFSILGCNIYVYCKKMVMLAVVSGNTGKGLLLKMLLMSSKKMLLTSSINFSVSVTCRVRFENMITASQDIVIYI